MVFACKLRIIPKLLPSTPMFMELSPFNDGHIIVLQWLFLGASSALCHLQADRGEEMENHTLLEDTRRRGGRQKPCRKHTKDASPDT
jgi:hypothetical protein|mmetsp:Transcript_79160/g.132207  ORF Transcript_79160/g.132207 Transcript_79160/m.132207 type:complete len:87 (-) Transcript_79160:83-343(-)